MSPVALIMAAERKRIPYSLSYSDGKKKKKKTLSPSLQLVWCSEVSLNLLNKAAK